MEITAVTFTNKAANEMKKRLGVLLGQKDADALILGTAFPSILDEKKADNRHVSCDLCKVFKAVWPTNRPTQQLFNHRRG
jgi:ATP-dependent exoDNAse (exonuclease V) beta subunit